MGRIDADGVCDNTRRMLDSILQNSDTDAKSKRILGQAINLGLVLSDSIDFSDDDSVERYVREVLSDGRIPTRDELDGIHTSDLFSVCLRFHDTSKEVQRLFLDELRIRSNKLSLDLDINTGHDAQMTLYRMFPSCLSVPLSKYNQEILDIITPIIPYIRLDRWKGFQSSIQRKWLSGFDSEGFDKFVSAVNKRRRKLGGKKAAASRKQAATAVVQGSKPKASDPLLKAILANSRGGLWNYQLHKLNKKRFDLCKEAWLDAHVSVRLHMLRLPEEYISEFRLDLLRQAFSIECGSSTDLLAKSKMPTLFVDKVSFSKLSPNEQANCLFQAVNKKVQLEAIPDFESVKSLAIALKLSPKNNTEDVIDTISAWSRLGSVIPYISDITDDRTYSDTGSQDRLIQDFGQEEGCALHLLLSEGDDFYMLCDYFDSCTEEKKNKLALYMLEEFSWMSQSRRIIELLRREKNARCV